MDGPARLSPPAPALERGPSSPIAKAAAALLQALTRAARSFLLYAPSNEVVRKLLAEYETTSRAALDRFGEIEIAVRPFEMLSAGEVVYRETDREKSLAFKLFRDGVRRLVLSREATWEELLHLLELLAVCTTAVRQQEEDLVTLLRKAEFHGIRIQAVEGFTPAEEEPELELDAAAGGHARRGQPPAGWDTPLPRLPKPGPLEYRPIPEEALAALRTLGGDDLAGLALALARDILAEAMRAGWPSPNADLTAFFAELRDGLLASGELASLRGLLDVLAEAGKSEMRDELLSGLGDARTLDLALASVPEDANELPPDLTPFLPLLGIGPALDRLAGDPNPKRRRLLTQLVLARLPGDADEVLRRLPALEPPLARELVRGLAARAPQRATDVGRQLLAQASEELRLEGLSVLESSSSGVPVRPLSGLLEDGSEPVRIRAAEVLGRRGGEAAVPPLRAALEGGRDRPARELEVLGRAMAEASPGAAAELFAEWMNPRTRFLRGLTARQRALQWAAIAGAALLPGEEAAATLNALAGRAKGDLRRHCLAALARRRKGAARADR